jgi:hypothetical protein
MGYIYIYVYNVCVYIYIIHTYYVYVCVYIYIHTYLSVRYTVLRISHHQFLSPSAWWVNSVPTTMKRKITPCVQIILKKNKYWDRRYPPWNRGVPTERRIWKDIPIGGLTGAKTNQSCLYPLSFSDISHTIFVPFPVLRPGLWVYWAILGTKKSQRMPAHQEALESEKRLREHSQESLRECKEAGP